MNLIKITANNLSYRYSRMDNRAGVFGKDHLTKTVKPRSLICIEGIDYTGKTTLCHRVQSNLMRKGYNAFYMHYPKKKPNLKLDKLNLIEHFLNEMKEDLPMIRYRVKHGFVILDRWFYSTFAYEGTEQFYNVILEKVKNYALPVPDLLVLIDASPESLTLRVRNEKRDLFENNIGFQKEVRKRYLQLVQQRPFEERVLILNALDDINTNIMRILQEIEQTAKLPV